MRAPVAIPLCKDTLYPYHHEGIGVGLFVSPYMLLSLINGRTEYWYNKPKQSPITLCARGQRAEIKGIAQTPNQEKINILDVMASGFLNEMMDEPSMFKVRKESILVGDNMYVSYLDFTKRVIGVVGPDGQTTTYAVPEDYLSSDERVSGLGIKWWSIAKAIACYFFGMYSKNKEPLKADDLRYYLQKVWIDKFEGVLYSVKPPMFVRAKIQNNRGNDELTINGKGEEEYTLLASVSYFTDAYVRGELYHFAHPSDFPIIVRRMGNSVVIAKEYYYGIRKNEGLVSYKHYDGERDATAWATIDCVETKHNGSVLQLGKSAWFYLVKMLNRNREIAFRFVLFVKVGDKVDENAFRFHEFFHDLEEHLMQKLWSNPA